MKSLPFYPRPDTLASVIFKQCIMLNKQKINEKSSKADQICILIILVLNFNIKNNPVYDQTCNMFNPVSTAQHLP